MALPWPYPVESLIRQGYLIETRTIAELAEKINVPARVIESTVLHVNVMAESGIDEDFKRGGNTDDRFYGDLSNNPNSNLVKCRKARCYALKLYPGNVSTMFGLNVDEDSRVLGDDNKPIEGLYAVGCDQNSVKRGTYPGGGSSIGPGMTLGFKLRFHLTGQKKITSREFQSLAASEVVSEGLMLTAWNLMCSKNSAYVYIHVSTS